MLTLYQRLILGCCLLIALVTGVSLLVRTSFVQLAALDASRHKAGEAARDNEWAQKDITERTAELTSN